MLTSNSLFAQSSGEATIGNQIWTSKNLNVNTFRNGEAIPEAKNAEEWKTAGENKIAIYCYYDYDSTNGDIYGKLYNWYAVNDPRGLAPIGYHIPNKSDWIHLMSSVGEDTCLFEKLRHTYEWKKPNNRNCRCCNNKVVTNISGFCGLPGGFCGFDGYFFLKAESGYWWSSNEIDSNNAWFFSIEKNGIVRNYFEKKSFGLSIRCISDSKITNDILDNKIVNEPFLVNPKNTQSNISVTDQFMSYLMRSNWIVTEYTPSFAKSMYGAKCKFTKNGFSYVPRYNGVYLDEIKYNIDIISIQENFPEGSKYSGAFNFYNLQQKNDTQKHAFLYLKEDVVLWKYGFNGYTINLVLKRI